MMNILKFTTGTIESSVNTYKNLKVNFLGDNSKVIINSSLVITKRIQLDVGDNSEIIIGKNCKIRELYANIHQNHFEIGEHVYIGSCLCYAHRCKGTPIYIGSHSMLSLGITIRASDEHTIYDLGDPTVAVNLRRGGGRIGNQVWVGDGVYFGKNSCIPNNCIVGARSVVTKNFTEENCILAGVPAKIIRTNVGWARTPPDLYQENMNDKGI